MFFLPLFLFIMILNRIFSWLCLAFLRNDSISGFNSIILSWFFVLFDTFNWFIIYWIFIFGWIFARIVRFWGIFGWLFSNSSGNKHSLWSTLIILSWFCGFLPKKSIASLRYKNNIWSICEIKLLKLDKFLGTTNAGILPTIISSCGINFVA